MTPRGPWSRLFFRRVDMVSGNRLRLLQSGADYFPALIAAIDAAGAEIYLETYIFNADATTEAVRDALVRAAQRGVQVRVLIDAIGSRELPAAWLDALKTAGVAVLEYRPLVTGWRSNPKSLRRLHRKVAVVDARVAFVGGMNLIDDFEPIRFPVARFDFSVEVQGPLIAAIHQSVHHLWRVVALSQLQPTDRKHSPVHPSWPTDGRVRAAFVTRDSFAHRRDIERSYLTALALARSDILIANAYFLPGNRFRKLLKKAAARGVRVQLLVQGQTDHPFFQAASRALYQDLLVAGVSIREYHASELHAKVAVVDAHWATVGSSNIDPFSLMLAREANIVVDDVAFAADLRERLQRAVDASAALSAADWKIRPWRQRLASRLAYALVRFLLGVARLRRWL